MDRDAVITEMAGAIADLLAGRLNVERFGMNMHLLSLEVAHTGLDRFGQLAKWESR